MSNDRQEWESQSDSGSKGISRRRFLQGLGAATLAPGVGGVAPAIASSRRLRSAYIPIVDSIPIPIAYEKGFFKEMGIKADKPQLMRGWSPLLEAFNARQVELTHILLFQVLFMRYERDIPVRSFAFNHLDGIAMLGSADVSDVSQLGGTTVGCPTWWAPHTMLLQHIVKEAGLTPVVDRPTRTAGANEVAFRVVRPPDMPNALSTGEIAGAVVSEPFGALAEKKAGANLLRMSGDVWHNHPCCQSVMMEDVIESDREWSRAVATAIARACAWCSHNREEMVDILSREGGRYFPVPRDILDHAVNNSELEQYGVEEGNGAIQNPEWDVKRLAFNPWPYRSAFKLSVESMREMTVNESVGLSERMKKLDPETAADETVDYEMIRKAIDTAGGIKQFPNVDGDNPFVRVEKFEGQL